MEGVILLEDDEIVTEDDVIEYPSSRYDENLVDLDNDIFVADDDEAPSANDVVYLNDNSNRGRRNRAPNPNDEIKRKIEAQLGLAKRDYSTRSRPTRSSGVPLFEGLDRDPIELDDDPVEKPRSKTHKKDKERKRRRSDSSSSSSESDISSDGDYGYSSVALMDSKEARKLVAKVNAGLTSKKKIPTRPSDLFPPWQLQKYLAPLPTQIQDMNCTEKPLPVHPLKRKKIRVLSLFDGISTGIVALKQLGIEVDYYYASEVDDCAIKCSKCNHPEIIQVGDVKNITEQDLIRWGPFDLLLGGSPCNDFSRVNPHREGFTGKWGRLFFDYARILNICRAKHEEDLKTTTPFYWLFENVIMDTEDRNTISFSLGCDPIKIDAMYVSPMKRPRLYWSNIPGLADPITANLKEDKVTLQECLEPGRKARVKRVGCITTQWSSQQQGKFLQDPVIFMGEPDRLWMVEIERCFGFPDHYTDVANLHPDKRLVLLGMSWSIPCIRHLLEPLLHYFKSVNSIAAVNAAKKLKMEDD